MHGKRKRGRDYTPLYRFLLSKVGEDWDSVFSEAKSRLDETDPIFRMVARTDDEKKACVWLGESARYSGLFVDEHGKLAKVDPDLTIEQLEPDCACCTHTFNGKRLTRKYSPPASQADG